MTPYEEMVECLRKALELLATDPRDDADDLCDRIVRLTEPAVCTCGRPANCLAFQRGVGHYNEDYDWVRSQDEVKRVCQECVGACVEADNPAYTHSCENCGCHLPIN